MEISVSRELELHHNDEDWNRNVDHNPGRQVPKGALVSATPPDVRKVSDLPSDAYLVLGGYAPELSGAAPWFKASLYGGT